MRRFLIINLVLLMPAMAPNWGATLAFGQDTPKAIITGPSSVAEPKRSIILRTEGSVGSTLKFSMSPKVPQSFSFRDDQTGELIFLYIPDNAGVYSVALAATTKEGKVDVTILQTTVGGPVVPTPVDPVIPTPKPKPVDPVIPPAPIADPLVKLYSDAVATDLAAGVGTKAQIQALADVYRAAAKVTVYNPALTKPQDVYNTMHAAVTKPPALVPDGQLPSLRKAMADNQSAYFKFPAGVTFATSVDGDKGTRDKMSAYFTRIADALAALVVANNATPNGDMAMINNPIDTLKGGN